MIMFHNIQILLENPGKKYVFINFLCYISVAPNIELATKNYKHNLPLSFSGPMSSSWTS